MPAPASLVIDWRPGRTLVFIVMNLTTSSSPSPPGVYGSWKEARNEIPTSPRESHIFRPAGVEHDVFNGGDQELIFVEIELVR
jgi:hypothetical protein